MKKIIIFLAVVSLPKLGMSQYKWDFGGSVGASNYLGDIGGEEKPRRDFIYDMKVSQTRVAAGGFARYKLSPSISVKSAVNYIRIQGNDALSANPERFSRNLSFRNNMVEFSTVGEWYFYKSSDMSGRPGMKGSKKRIDFRTYMFVGVGALYSNPQAELGGTWYNLREYKTENVSYGPVAVVIPAGIGFTYTINRHYRIGFEFGFRQTFTDYLDDVSSRYPKEIFQDETGVPGTPYNSLRANLSNRNVELTSSQSSKINPTNYGWSQEFNGDNLNKRGDDTHNDNYLTAQLSFSYVIKGKNSFYKQKYKSLTQRRKVVKRKTRAKF
ncbi:MAG: DUF6089 family protein [Bacteroidota bacterium]